MMGTGRIILASISVFIVGCSPSTGMKSSMDSLSPGSPTDIGGPEGGPIEIEPGTPEDIDEAAAARWESSSASTNREWTLYAFKQIDTVAPALVERTPSDIENFCPSYPNLTRAKKKNFWVYLLSAMAELESGFNPALNYTEDFTDSSGRRVISRGLMQLSHESALGYGCPLKKDTDLNSPKVNLDCALRILNRWVKTDGVIRGGGNGAWKGGARYWAVLRNAAHFDRIRTWTKLQSDCH